MKRIMNGRLWDDSFMNSIASRAFDVVDPVTGETKQYREELLREYVLKPGHTLEDTWVEGSYGRRIIRDNCDLRKGQFVLKRHLSYSDGVFLVISDDEARAWFERHLPESTDLYEEIFGPAENPWTGDGTVKLVEQAESRASSLKWDKERAEENLKKAEAELAAARTEIESLRVLRDMDKDKLAAAQAPSGNGQQA